MSARPAIALAALLLACSESSPPGGSADGGPTLVLSAGGITLDVHSGATVLIGNVFHLYLSDQPDACLGVGLYPQRTWNRLTLIVAPSAEGSVARVVPPQVVPAAGQAMGQLVRATADRPPDASLDTSDGTVDWAANADGSVTIRALDVGFAGTADRIRTGVLTLPRCAPQ